MRPPDLGGADFRRLVLAVAASELGDSLHYIALMWFALGAGGARGVIAVRLADSIPALVFGLHGGLAADRFSRKRLMVGADVARALVLVPVAAAGLAGSLPLWGLVVASFLLESATSYFEPAYGAVVPALVDRGNVQQANALVQTTAQALSIGGWAVAAGLLAFMPVGAFFAVNAASFAISAVLISRIRHAQQHDPHAAPPRLHEGVTALRPRPLLAAGVVVFGVAVTLTAGAWIGGVPIFVRDTLHHGAGGFSIVMVGYALGAIVSGLVLARLPIRRKARASLLTWALCGPGFGLLAVAHSLETAVTGAFFAAAGQSSAIVLLNSAAQEEVPDGVLGRVVSVISLTHRGADATGLLLVSPLFAFVAARWIFGVSAVAVPLVGLAGFAGAIAYSRRRAMKEITTNRTQRRRRARRLTGLVLAVAALGVVCAGVVAAVARSGGTYVDLGAHGTYSTDRYVLATSGTDWRRQLLGWAGSVRLEVAPASRKPIFVGVAPAGAVRRYLSGTGYTTVGERSRTGHDGTAPASPSKLVGWTAHAAGVGTQTLRWNATGRSQIVLAMNADRSRPLRVRIVSSAVTLDRMPWWAPVGTLALGTLSLLAAVALLTRDRRQARGGPG